MDPLHRDPDRITTAPLDPARVYAASFAPAVVVSVVLSLTETGPGWLAFVILFPIPFLLVSLVHLVAAGRSRDPEHRKANRVAALPPFVAALFGSLALVAFLLL